ncbi:ATP-binding protein [Sanguibacter sp. 25GB23B1]|uniref:ATP-binding protein n=1 Tax=unclassified Sanguibacter TaxID=2645534 RepID=UPI0032AFC864
MTVLRTSRPPDDFRLVQRWDVDSAGALAGLRSSLHEAITGAVGAPRGDFSQTPDKMVLVASELATNALRHAKAPRSVRLFARDHELLLDVVDHDVASSPVVAGVRPAGEGGFGLKLAQRLAAEVGWYARGTAKHVWACFPATDAEAESVARGSRRRGGARLVAQTRAFA